MRRAAVATAVAAAVVGCGSAASTPSDTAAAQPATSLTISFWESGREQGAPKRWTLRCRPAGGSHTRAAQACSRLFALQRPFAPPPKDLACTQIYGGPEQALVTGVHHGRRVWTQLSLSDGCQIARFKALAFLVPGFSAGARGATS